MFEPFSEFTHRTPLKDITNQNQNSTATDSTAVVTNPTANKANVPLKLTKPEHYRCKECKFTTKHSSNLIRHRRIHTGKYSCEKCPNKYQTMHDLNTHKRIKHDSPLICELCSKSFRSTSGLYEHKNAVKVFKRNNIMLDI